MNATMTATTENFGPYVRRRKGTTVTGDEARRLVGLGLAEYNEVEPLTAPVVETPTVNVADGSEQEES